MPSGVYARTAEARANMSAAAKKRYESPEERAKMSVISKNRWESPEMRAKVSASLKGKRLSPETRAKMSSATKKQWESPEYRANISAKVRAKMSVIVKKRCESPEYRAKLSAAHKGKMKGPKHPQWRGGISREPYAWEWNDELREEVRRRDGYRCQLCGVPQAECKTALPVHHIDYCKRNSDPVNLTALCVPCNSKVNANRKHWTAVFQAKAIKQAIAEL